MNRVIILGSSIAGNLAALYLRKRLPELQVTLVGRTDRRRPLVGESTVEVTCHFLEALGLGALLEERQLHKYSLTYYFKQDLARPECRRYTVHEAQGVLRMPAYNLNRVTFDRDLREQVRALGVETVEADAVDHAHGETPDGRHRLTVRHADGREKSLSSRWLIDATGRSRFLAQRLGLKKPASWQRSCYWFRLADFDRSRLTALEATRPHHHCFDPYYVTHHFYGRGYWIWLIPMRSESGGNLISVGLTYRPDLLDAEVTSHEDFLERVRREHPVVADFVESGRVLDTNVYRNYMYEASQYYSDEGWFLLGDAGFSLDPSNSAGLASVAHQVPQISAIIQKEREGTLAPEYVRCLDQHLKAQLSLQDTWSRWYEMMHQPVKMAWTLLVSNLAYFHVVLPNYVNGAFLDGRQAQAFAELLPRFLPEAQPAPHPFAELLDAVVAQQGDAAPGLLTNQYGRVVNWALFKADEQARPRYAARYFAMLASLRWQLLRELRLTRSRASWRLWGRGVKDVLADLLRAAVLLAQPSRFYPRGGTPAHLRSPFSEGFLEFPRAPLSSPLLPPDRDWSPSCSPC